MKTRIFSLVIIVLFALSCNKNNDKEYRKKIIGEWGFDKQEIKSGYKYKFPPPSILNSALGYVFYENGIYKNNRGFFRIDKERTKATYLGDSSTYKIKNNQLILFDPAQNKYLIFKIKSISEDSLIFQDNDTTFSKYKKEKYVLEQRRLYDKIIYSAEGCFGRCAVEDLCFDTLGNAFYQGWRHVQNEGVYIAKISKNRLDKALYYFRKVNIDSLDTDYGNCDDAPTFSVTFVKNNRIVKTVIDRCDASPVLFIWAYQYLNVLKKDLKLNLIELDNKINQKDIAFSTKNQIAYLTQSESFFFGLELRKSPKVQHVKFNEKYSIAYWIYWKDIDDNKVGQIKTDGRYYKLANGFIYDLGYNFIQENNIHKRFRKK